jgi:hypothetical protein
MISKYATCAKFRRNNQREPLMPHPIPNRPWSKLGADIFSHDGRDYLIVVDYFSKYPEVMSLQTKTAREIVRKLKSLFSRHGIPDVFMSDNMPFASQEMKQFAKEWQFDLVTSSPTYPQSNGQSERFVQTVKNIMKKCLEDGHDLHLALLNYRASPIAGLDYSPSELLMSRKLKTKLPTTESQVMPQVVNNAREHLQSRQNKYKAYFDQGTKVLPPLSNGDSVRVRREKTWESAVVSHRDKTPRSYVITTPEGYSYRRNRKHLQSVKEPAPVIQPLYEHDSAPSGTSEVPVVPDINTSANNGNVANPPTLNTQNTAVRRSSRETKFPEKYKDFVVKMKS